jgi:uncharacterized membrane protein YebE (DUF533 family)
MIDVDKIIDALRTHTGAAAERLQNDPATRNMAMVGAGGVLAGLLAGRMSPRFAGAAARLGGLAALGGLAYYAWRRHESRQAGQYPPEATGDQITPPPAGFLGPPDQAKRHGVLLLRAMINAAKADGQIDSEEKARLFDRLGAVELSAEEQRFLFDELARPMDTDALAREASSAPGLAAQVYAASLLAIDPDLPAERDYLADLAARLRLEPGLVRELHAAAG